MDAMMRVMLAAGGGGGGGGGSFPTAGLLGWWKADAGVTKDGSDKVSQWDDQSGNGKHLVQATGARQPTWAASVLSGLPAISFPSGTGLPFPTLTGVLSIYVVVTYPNSTWNGNSTLLSGAGGGAAFPPEMWGFSGGTQWQFNPLVGLYRRNGSVRAVNESISPLNRSHLIVGYASSARVFTSQMLGNWTDYFSRWLGHVHELAVWNAQLSGGDITSVENYATSRYGTF